MTGLLTLSKATAKFLDYLESRKGRSATTVNTYRSSIGLFIEFVGDIPITDLKVSMIDDYADTLTHYKPKTLRNRLTPIRSLLAFLYAKDLIDIRKESVDLPTVTEIEANFLTPDEQVGMVHACKDLRERALVLFLIRSGLRVSELINAHYDDLYDRSIVIRKGKGGKPRITFITDDADTALKLYHQEFSDDQMYLFPSENGSKISRQYIARLITVIARRAGITKKVSPHTLRHTFATNLLMAGARVEDVQKMMGHTNIRTTLIYMHFTNEYLKSSYDKVDQKALV